MNPQLLTTSVSIRQRASYNPEPMIENEQVFEEENAHDALPPLHLHAYKGDLEGVMGCIADGHDVHSTVIMRNQASRLVCGITPLFLAAQRGHGKVVKMLVQSGANPAQPAYIQGSAELCTPAQVARLNLHFLVAHYLKKQCATRKLEDAVLREEELAADRNARAAVSDPSKGAQHHVMARLGDLTNWDPTTGNQPELLNGQALSKMLRNQKVDLEAWRPDVERSPDGAEMMVSISRPVDPDELEEVQVADHAASLNTFLRDANLMAWNPADQGALVGSVAATRRTSLDLDSPRFNRNNSVSNSRSVSRNVSRNASPIRGMSALPPGVPLQQQEPIQTITSTINIPRSGQPLRENRPGRSMTSASSSLGGSFNHRGDVDAPRAAARAAAAAAMTRAPRLGSSNASRWYAHNDSDSDGDEDLQISGSVPAAPPPEAALRA